MIKSFQDEGTKDIYHGDNTKDARHTLPRENWSTAVRKLDMIESAETINDLKVPPGNRLEKLEGHEHRWSVRINQQYRIVFDWIEGEAHAVSITDYH